MYVEDEDLGHISRLFIRSL